MEFLKQWLLGITGTTLILAIAESMMPSGGVKQVGKLICGLILLLMIINPVLQLSPDHLALMSDSWHNQFLEEQALQENNYNEQLKLRIESDFEAYIVDKAMEVGITCQPTVLCELDEMGIYLPVFVDIGVNSVENASYLRQFIEQDFGVDSSVIHGKEEIHEYMENSTHRTMEGGDGTV